MSFKEIKPEELNFNPFTRIGSDWMLLTAGTEDKFNTMTASWGGLGHMYNKPVAFRHLLKIRTLQCSQTLLRRIWT